MRLNLLKLFSLLLLWSNITVAEDFTYSFHVDSKTPYVKEPIILTLTLEQNNPNMVLMFNFDLAESKNYSFQRLDTKESDLHPTKGLHNAKVKYTYLVYPLVSGGVKLHFKLLKKVTTDDSVAYSFSGDRDNVKGLVTIDTSVVLPPLELTVKALPKGTQIVGNFILDFKVKQHKADAFEPLPFQVTLKGFGYPPLLDLLPKDVNFTVFTEKPLVKSVSTIQGTHSTVYYPIALSHFKSFTFDSINLKAFNPKTEKIYMLSIPEQNFNITEVDKASLLDKIDSPKVLKSDWSWLTVLLTYLIVFVAGCLTVLFWKWTKKVQRTETSPLKGKIQNCKNHKALLQILLAHDSQHFSAVIKTLESSLYGDGKINPINSNLKKVKKEAMDMI
jgi:hypothetical protein